MDVTRLCDCPGWPTVRFGSPPPIDQAIELGSYCAQLGQATPGSLADPAIIAQRLGILIRTRELEGSLEALLIPMSGGGFHIVLHPGFKPRTEQFCHSVGPKEQILQLLVNLRIGHELGHTFFYNWLPHSTKQPKRLRSVNWWSSSNNPEEVWCDRFAEALVAADQIDYNRQLIKQLTDAGREHLAQPSH